MVGSLAQYEEGQSASVLQLARAPAGEAEAEDRDEEEGVREVVGMVFVCLCGGVWGGDGDEWGEGGAREGRGGV